MSNLTRRDFIKLTSAAALAMAVPVEAFAASDCTVKTRYGTFNGFVDKQGVKTWLGIPYAQPPVGKLRWQAPQPLKPTNKTRDAKKFGASAMQEDDKLEEASQNFQSEDCLTLNIWTRGGGKNKPVMVFIHGGAFQSGGSSDPLYNGSNFAAAQDVVIVTINYRLHVFGFVNFGAIDSAFEDSGYLGMKDQVAALQWVKENIAAFGGNPDNVTIFGESAGAVSVMLLMVIPAAKGLFNKAIPQSANSYMHGTPENFQVAEMYMEFGGAKSMRDMMKKSSAELEQLYEKIKAARLAEAVMDYLPICDGKFIPREPFKALKDGGARGIKMLTGTTADEWRYWFLLHGETFFEMFRDDPKKLSPAMMKYTARTPQEIYRAWLKNRPDTEDNFADFVNQLDWCVGQELAAEYQSPYDDAYYYLFSQQSPNEKLRSCHAMDLPFVFNNPDSDLEPNPPQNLVRAVQASWAALAMAVPVEVFAASDCTVKTRYGTFNGFVDKQGVKTWLGIPYAQPPVGKLRWQAPQPLKPSNKTRDAKKFGFTAVQNDDANEAASTNPQSEDCLTLNVFRRGEKKNLPVMMFIHGGSFVGGGTTDPLYYGSNFAAANDVVLVTINYRLNIFGFMNFAAIDPTFEDCGGYLGTKDQIAALKWIKENISAFGGNPDNVTVFGESAGSISTMMLTIVPAAKGLFGKAIPQSATVAMHSKPEFSAQLAEMFMNLSGTRKMSDLMKKSTAELKDTYGKLADIRASNHSSDYLVTCDGKFTPLDPMRALKDGAARGIKILTGTTSDEWNYFLLYNEKYFEILRDGNQEKISPAIRHYKARTPEEIYRAWLNERPDTMENYEAFVNQVDWRVGQELCAEYQSAFDDVYYYLFSQQSPNEKLRSCHALDLPYTFNNPDKDLESNPNQNLVKAMQASWAAFAATGNPNNEFIPHWEKYSANNRQTMELNSKGCVCHKDLNTQNLNALRYVYEG